MPKSSWNLGFLLLALVFSASGPALAKEKRTQVVMLAGTDRQDLAQRAHQAIAGWLTEMPASIKIHWVKPFTVDSDRPIEVADALFAAGKGVRLVIWSDYSNLDKIYIYRNVRRGDRLTIREISEADSWEGRVESLAFIVRSTLESMIREDRDRDSRAAVSWESWFLNAHYALRAATSTALTNSGGGVGFGLNLLSEWYLAGELAIRSNTQATDAAKKISLNFDEYDLKLCTGYDWLLGGSVLLGLGVSAHIGFLPWSASPKDRNDTTLKISDKSVPVILGGDLSARIGWAVRPYLRFVLSAGVELRAQNQDFTMLVDNQPNTIMKIPDALPHIILEVVWFPYRKSN